MRTYKYAVIETVGRHSSGEKVCPVYATNDRTRAIQRAVAKTKEYLRSMATYGVFSGGYVAVEWNAPARETVLGHEADQLRRVL